MKKFIIAVILLLGVVFVYLSFSEVEKIFYILQRGNWYYMLLAAVVSFTWMINLGATYRAIYRAMGMRETLWRMFELSSAGFFMNVVTPSVGASTLALFVRDGTKRGHPSGKITAALAAFLLFDYVGLLASVTLGLTVLIRRNNISWSEITASSILLLMAVGLATLIYLGSLGKETFGKALAWIAKGVNRVVRIFIRRDYLSVERAYLFADEASEGMVALRQNPKGLVMPMVYALNNKALLIVVMWLVFLAFKVPYSPGTVVAGFSIGYLFVIVSPTPFGIGVVEGVLPLTLRTLRVPFEMATVATHAFRALTFWLPLITGMFTFRKLAAEGDGQSNGDVSRVQSYGS
ncbi:MAG: flippase-like domain-containing protein [Anaerolineae bacterium]|jgi:hypothetical protein|nr:flippase-like domain-containing protein [Anaerolineae bacterium]